MDSYIENDITEIVLPSFGKDLLVKSSIFYNLPGCIFAASLGNCNIGWSVFERSHTNNTIFIGAATNIVYEGNCIIECSGERTEIEKDYGRVARILGDSIFSSFNHYYKCDSKHFLEFLYSDELEHYSSNYSLNQGEKCAGLLIQGSIKLVTKLIYSYKCESIRQLELFNSPKTIVASKFVFVDCTSSLDDAADLICWSITTNTIVSDSSFIGNKKKYDCGVALCKVTFQRFFFSRSEYKYWYHESGTATNVDCKLNEPEVKQSLGVFRKGCVGQICSECKKKACRSHLSIGILGFNPWKSF